MVRYSKGGLRREDIAKVDGWRTGLRSGLGRRRYRRKAEKHCARQRRMRDRNFGSKLSPKCIDPT